MTTLLAGLYLASLGSTVPVTPSSGFAEAREPQVAVQADGTVFVAFGMGNAIYCSISHDRGASYASPLKIAEAGQMALGMRRGPRIATAGKTVVVSAVYGQEGKGRDGDILAWRSADGGKTWMGPARVNNVPGAAREGLHGMAGSPTGAVACAWLDLRQKGTRIYGASSQDGGRTWSANALVYESPDGTVCQCCHPSVAYGPDGKLFVMWRNALRGARDLYLADSADGKAFGPAKKLGTGTWPLDSCPMDGGSLAVMLDGAVSTVWRRDRQILACRPGQAEVDLGPGEQPWTAAGPDGVYTVWLIGRGRAVKAVVPGGNAQARTLAEAGDDPVVAASTNGPAVAAWAVPGQGIASAVLRP